MAPSSRTSALPSRALILTATPILEALGDDTSDPGDFPKRPNGKVDGFNNLWIVSIDRDGKARLKEHVVLDFALVEQDDEDEDDDDDDDEDDD